MNTVTTEGIIYKTYNYSDSSAIAIAFTKDYGKIKLFIKKAFSKKGGVWKFIPLHIKFYKKEESDLHKLYSINQIVDYYYFLDIPDIYLRLHLFFEMYDILNEVELPDEQLWQLLLRIDKNNIHKASIYIIYHLITTSGLMFDVSSCHNCGKDFYFGKLSFGGLFCNDCCSDAYIPISQKQTKVLQALTNNKDYKEIHIDKKLELEILEIFVKYLKITQKINIKGIEIIKTLL